jgi:hypothetical protein
VILIELAGLVRGVARRVGGVATVRAPHRHPLHDTPGLRPGAPAVTWTAADLLAGAAGRLPEAPDGYTPGAIHETLFDLARVLLGAADGGCPHRLAGEAEALLAAYLIGVRQAPPRASAAETLRAWPDRRDLVAVVTAMAAAARHGKRFLNHPRRWPAGNPTPATGGPAGTADVAGPAGNPWSRSTPNDPRAAGCSTARTSMFAPCGQALADGRPPGEGWPGNLRLSPSGNVG